MNTKKAVLFTGTAAVVAAGLVYTLGIYPPAASRDAQGAIGQRQVYRADQSKDASVTPGEAPVAAKAEVQQAQLNDKGVLLAQPDNGKQIMHMAKPDNDKQIMHMAKPDNDKQIMHMAKPDNDKQIMHMAKPDNDKQIMHMAKPDNGQGGNQ